SKTRVIGSTLARHRARTPCSQGIHPSFSTNDKSKYHLQYLHNRFCYNESSKNGDVMYEPCRLVNLQQTFCSHSDP
ncbi:hypothetical protein GIB67_012723, partial [Kingdonia uniflora]